MDIYEKILKKAENEMLDLKHPYVGTEHLLLAILSDKTALTDYLKTKKLTYRKFKNKLINIVGTSTSKSKFILYTPMLRTILKHAEDYAEENNTEITETMLFNAIIEEGEGIAIRVISAMNINPSKLKYQEEIKIKDGVIINDIVKDEVILGRNQELASIIQILLRKNKCNPLLIGKAGVGKSAIIEELARRINNNQVPDRLKNYKILKIDFGSLVAGTKYRGEFEDKITKLIHEVMKHQNIILFVDEAHTIVNAGGADGAISAGDIFKPFLARGDIKLIGATTINEYHKFMENDKALNRRFQTVLIEEPDYNQTKDILNAVKKEYETFHDIKISPEIITDILDFSNKYLQNKANPDKSLEILDTLCTQAKYENKSTITKNDITNLIYSRYHVNYALDKDQIITKALDNNLGLEVPNIEEFKKKLSKIYNSNLYTNIDLNNYNSEYTMYQLIGYPNQPDKEYLFRKYIDNPFGVIFLQNIDTNLNNPLLDKLLKNKHLIDTFGNDIDFHNILFVTTAFSSHTSIGFINTPKSNDILSKYFINYQEIVPIK